MPVGYPPAALPEETFSVTMSVRRILQTSHSHAETGSEQKGVPATVIQNCVRFIKTATVRRNTDVLLMRSYLSAGDCDEIAQVYSPPGGHQYDCSPASMQFPATRHDDLPGNFSQLSGCKEYRASTHRDNKLQLTASGLSELSRIFQEKIFLSVFQLIPYAWRINKVHDKHHEKQYNNKPSVTTKRSVSILLLYR